MKKDVYENDDLIPIILYIPKDAVRLKIDVTMIDSDNDECELFHAESVMAHGELINACIDGREWEDNNIKYVINEEYFNETNS